MKCQTLFSGKNKKNITILPSAEFSKRVINVYRLMMQTARYKTGTSIILR